MTVCVSFLNVLFQPFVERILGEYQGIAIEKENKLKISHDFIKCKVSVSFGNYKTYTTHCSDDSGDFCLLKFLPILL